MDFFCWDKLLPDVLEDGTDSQVSEKGQNKENRPWTFAIVRLDMI